MQDRSPLSQRRLLQRTAGPYIGSFATDRCRPKIAPSPLFHRKRQTCATTVGTHSFRVGWVSYAATVAPRLFPGAPRGIRWRPNVPPHWQRDRDSISDCGSWLNGRCCLSPGWADGGQFPDPASRPRPGPATDSCRCPVASGGSRRDPTNASWRVWEEPRWDGLPRGLPVRPATDACHCCRQVLSAFDGSADLG